MKYFKKIVSWLLIIGLTLQSMYGLSFEVKADEDEPYVVSLGRMVYASSFKDNNTPENAVDGSLSSRYESEWKVDPQWFYVDLGKPTEITGIIIDWKGAYAKDYVIQFSDDEENWVDKYEKVSGKGGREEIDVSGKTRYVRIYMTKRALTAYGYSFNEFEVYGYDGLTKRPVDYGENIALNKEATASEVHITDSMYDEDGNLDDSSVRASNAVDGSATSKFVSEYNDNQWIQVDLGQEYEIGRVIVEWTSDAGKIYDIQTSTDGINWTTMYRQLSGYASAVTNIGIYAKARYVRVYGYTRVNTGNGFCIYELEVYKYNEGDEKVVHNIMDLPQLTVVDAPEGEGSYVTEAMYLEKAKLPIYKTENVEVPIATNDWWQSSIMQRFGNLLCIMPLKAKYSTKGLNVLTGTEGWLPTPSETAVNFSVKSETLIDLYFMPDSFNSTESYDQVSKYSDYTATIDLCDDSGVLMSTTYVKGSPYLFTELGKTTKLYLTAPNLVKIFDDNGNSILEDGQTLVTDHIGVMVTDDDNEDKTYTSTSYYCLNFPEGTTFKNTGGTIRITLPSTNGYMSVGTMLKEEDLNLFYQHGYAFVTDTKVTYAYDENTAKISTVYTATTDVKRAGFSNVTMQCMLPHQWKNSVDDTTAIGTYTSVRGDMKCILSNKFSTSDTFYGMIPTFAMPDNEEFDVTALKTYLNNLDSSKSNLTPSSDAYWEGKNVHPLAMGALMADQIGDAELRDEFLARIKKILVNWFNYDGEDDKSFFIYDEHWGTLYYKQSEFGANTSIADHHFTYGYFLFGASVLANYDEEFYNSYKGMIELLIRDYGNYSDKDDLFCKFRNYDVYEGHSWAGGYANNDSGNNQESASEALFSWVGMYLWGVLTGNDNYRDAGVYGFTTEMEAVKQYWFNYDGDNWVEDYPYQVVAQVYGGTNFFGTFFGGQPLYCYGIQWLPVSEYLTTYGMEQERCAEIYQGLLDDTETAILKSQLTASNAGKTQEEIDEIRNKYSTPDTGWQHITWSYYSMTNPTAALNKFANGWSGVQKSDQANTYWYINSMLQIGYKTSDIIATGDIAATVYYNEATDVYTAMAWNPTDKVKVVTLLNKGKKIGVANVDAHSLIKFEIPKATGFEINQTQAPYFNTKEFYSGAIKEHVSNSETYDDNVYVEIKCKDKNATIYYTTDGTTPTIDSKVYTGPMLVSNDTTIIAYTVKEGCIDSSYSSLSVTINGTSTTGDENLALNAPVVVSSEENVGTLASYITDGKSSTRWSSKFTDEQWCYVELGGVHPVNTVSINWQNSYAEKYEILVSVDKENWTKVADVFNNASGVKTTEFDAIYARYVKMNGLQRHTEFGYSMWEMEVYAANKVDAPIITEKDLGDGTKEVSISTTIKGALIKYTLDGTVPTWESNVYTGPFVTDIDTKVIALVYRQGMITDVAANVDGIIELETPFKKPADGNNEMPIINVPIIEDKEDTETNEPEDNVPDSDEQKETNAGEQMQDETTTNNVLADENRLKKTKVKKAKLIRNGKKAKVSVKKIKGAIGYQIKISTSKKFKKKKTITKNVTKKSFTIKLKKLAGKKRLFVKARAYMKVNGIKVYGRWSNKKKLKNM